MCIGPDARGRWARSGARCATQIANRMTGNAQITSISRDSSASVSPAVEAGDQREDRRDEAADQRRADPDQQRAAPAVEQPRLPRRGPGHRRPGSSGGRPRWGRSASRPAAGRRRPAASAAPPCRPRSWCRSGCSRTGWCGRCGSRRAARRSSTSTISRKSTSAAERDAVAATAAARRAPTGSARRSARAVTRGRRPAARARLQPCAITLPSGRGRPWWSGPTSWRLLLEPQLVVQDVPLRVPLVALDAASTGSRSASGCTCRPTAPGRSSRGRPAPRAGWLRRGRSRRVSSAWSILAWMPLSQNAAMFGLASLLGGSSRTRAARSGSRTGPGSPGTRPTSATFHLSLFFEFWTNGYWMLAGQHCGVAL